MTNFRIGSYFEIPDTDYDQPAPFTWKEFYDFRNHVLRVLWRFGSAGPLGEVDLSVDSDDEPSFNKNVVEDPDFFVVDDMYNEHDRLSIVECDPKHITSGLIESLSDMAQDFPGWCVSFSLGDSGLRVSWETVSLGGRRFWDCGSVEEIADRCANPVDFGLPGPFSEDMYQLWVAMVCGEVRSSMVFPDPRDRQWTQVIRSLEHMLGKRTDGHLNSFAYDQIRNDLHPETKHQFLLRLLDDISSFSPKTLKGAIRNIEKDAAYALANAPDHDERTALVQSIALSQQAVAAKLEAKEIVNWWANVIDYLGEPFEDVKQVLITELRGLLRDSNTRIQLSAIFALARLHLADIASVVDEATKANEQWSANQKLTKWLEQLRLESTSWPNGSFLP